MKTMLTGALAAAALALTTIAPAPARAADAEDVAGLILGLGALYAIGRALENDDRKAQSVTRYRQDDRRWDERRYHDDRYWRDDRHAAPRHRVLPAECLRTIQTRQGPVHGLGLNCIERTVARPGRLPSECLRTVRTNYGSRSYFAPRCLRRNGWEIADRPYAHWRD